MRKKLVLAILGILSFHLHAAADVVFLKGGQRLEGELSDKGAHYEIKTDFGTLAISKGDVEKLVKSVDSIVAEAEVLHRRARSLYEEALKIQGDPKATNAKLKAAVDLLRQVVQMYGDARETYSDAKYAHLDGTPISIIQEMRLYRDKMTSELAASSIPLAPPSLPALPIRPEPPPPSPEEPKKLAQKVDGLGLLAKANAGDADAQYALGAYYDSGEPNPPEALKWFRSAAEKNHPLAADSVGRLYQRGSGGVKQDYKEAIKWFKKAESLGCTRAQVHLAEMVFSGWGCTKNIEQADALCEKVLPRIRAEADQGGPEAQFLLGWMYSEGMGLPPSQIDAIKRIRQAADQGYVFAIIEMGLRYKRGRGVEKDLTKAIEWYQRAADLGAAAGKVGLAKMYDDELGREQPNLDYSKAFYWYRKAAAQGDCWGQYYVGHMYMHGVGTAKDQAEAVKMYQLSQNTAGDSCRRQALRSLGYAYEKGWGVKQDVKKAMEFYRTAADLGDLPAHHNLGYLTETVLKNPKEAFNWYMKAAKEGMPESQTNVGNCYWNGRGVIKNLDEAEKWLVMAAQHGQPQGTKYLEQVRAEKAAQPTKKP